MWVWRRMLEVPWTAGKTNVSILEQIKPELTRSYYLQIKANLLWTCNEEKWTGETAHAWKNRGSERKGKAKNEMDGWSEGGHGKISKGTKTSC